MQRAALARRLYELDATALDADIRRRVVDGNGRAGAGRGVLGRLLRQLQQRVRQRIVRGPLQARGWGGLLAGDVVVSEELRLLLEQRVDLPGTETDPDVSLDLQVGTSDPKTSVIRGISTSVSAFLPVPFALTCAAFISRPRTVEKFCGKFQIPVWIAILERDPNKSNRGAEHSENEPVYVGRGLSVLVK